MVLYGANAEMTDRSCCAARAFNLRRSRTLSLQQSDAIALLKAECVGRYTRVGSTCYCATNIRAGHRSRVDARGNEWRAGRSCC